MRADTVNSMSDNGVAAAVPLERQPRQRLVLAVPADGTLCYGLMDWDFVGPMNVAMAIWGAMCAETEMWDHHLAELLSLFPAELGACGDPRLDVASSDGTCSCMPR
jgi:hypothetical protein